MLCYQCNKEFEEDRKNRKFCSSICYRLYNRTTYQRARNLNNPRKAMFNRAKQRANIKGWKFDLDVSDIIIPEYCPVLGIKLTRSLLAKGGSDNSPSIDRLNPNKGYIKDNIRVISMRANYLNSNSTVEELTKILEDKKRILSWA